MADLDAASLADVKNWFQQHYGPNNAVLVLAGDIDVGDARRRWSRNISATSRAAPRPCCPPRRCRRWPRAKYETIKDRVATTRSDRVVGGARAQRSGSASRSTSPPACSAGWRELAARQRAGAREKARGARPARATRASRRSASSQISVDVKPGRRSGGRSPSGSTRSSPISSPRGPTADEVQRVPDGVDQRADEGAGIGRRVRRQGGRAGVGRALFERSRLLQEGAGRCSPRETPAKVKAVTAKWLTRPVYALDIVPGPRDAYDEAAVPPAKPVKAADDDRPSKGTRGGIPAIRVRSPTSSSRGVEHATLANGIDAGLRAAHRGAGDAASR